MGLTESEARIVKVYYYNERDSYSVLRLRLPDGREVRAVGTFPQCEDISVKKEPKCLFRGHPAVHPKYGRYIALESIRLAEEDNLFFFLTNLVKGIGKQLARRMIEEYGEEELERILDQEPERLLEFKGVKEKKLSKIVASWRKHKALKRLSDFFSTRGAPQTTKKLLKIYKHFDEKGEDPIEAVSKNPYVLTEIHGIGFKTADEIALSLGVDPTSPERIDAYMDYFLKTGADNGDTYKTVEQLGEGFETELYKDDDFVDISELSSVVRRVLESDEKYYYDGDKKIIALSSLKKMEISVMNALLRRAKTKSPYTVPPEMFKKFIEMEERRYGIHLSDAQYEAVRKIAVDGKTVFFLCGYAGTGKTTVSKIILDFFREFFVEKSEITCCAFTGMASKRVAEVTGYGSSTIHSLLGYSVEDGKPRFKYNERNPLPYSVILLDEASMVNLYMFYHLVSAIKEGSVFILVGDDAQLPPIGAGNIFSDMLGMSEIPRVTLTRIYRQSEKSVISYFASFVRKGDVPYGIGRKYDDFEFIKIGKKKGEEGKEAFYRDVVETLQEEIRRTIETYEVRDPIRRIQVIAPIKKSPIGTVSLNAIVQEMLNPNAYGVRIGETALKEGDKVIHLKNQNRRFVELEEYELFGESRDLYLFSSDAKEDRSVTRVFNGTIGYVLHIDEESELFSVLYPDDGDRVVIYSFDELGDVIDLGYALTVHKVQGNQFDYVFMPISYTYYTMLNNKLFYTALTRAKKRVVIFGEEGALKMACRNVYSVRRQTFVSLARENRMGG